MDYNNVISPYFMPSGQPLILKKLLVAEIARVQNVRHEKTHTVRMIENPATKSSCSRTRKSS